MCFRYLILNSMFSNSFWQISLMDCPFVSNCWESTNLRALHTVEMGTNAEIKYFFNVSFQLALVSKYTAASQVYSIVITVSSSMSNAAHAIL